MLPVAEILPICTFKSAILFASEFTSLILRGILPLIFSLKRCKFSLVPLMDSAKTWALCTTTSRTDAKSGSRLKSCQESQNWSRA